jgi:hypothetical protein
MLPSQNFKALRRALQPIKTSHSDGLPWHFPQLSGLAYLLPQLNTGSLALHGRVAAGEVMMEIPTETHQNEAATKVFNFEETARLMTC